MPSNAQIVQLRRLLASAEQRACRARVTRPADVTPAANDTPASRWQTGVAAIDEALPAGGLDRQALHEISGLAHTDRVAATGYAAALVRQLSDVAEGGTQDTAGSGPVLWCQTAEARREFGPVYGHGLRSFGLDPDRLCLVETRRDRDLLWALEEGARCPDLTAVIGEIGTLSFTATRRLSLAAAAGGTPVLLLRAERGLPLSAARTRWRVVARPGEADMFGLGLPEHPRWQLDLLRCRGGRPGTWTVEWNYETHRFRLAARVAPRLSSTTSSQTARPSRTGWRQAAEPVALPVQRRAAAG